MKKLGKALTLVSLLLWPAALLAAAPDQVYTIKKGDTLWSISQRFIKDPHYWPSLWANNPAVTNPHLIYPGQRVAIRDGRLIILPGEEAAAKPVAAVEQTQLPTLEEAVTVKARRGTEGFVSIEELAAAGTLVDAEDDRIMLTDNSRIFVHMHDAEQLQPGAKLALVEIGRKVKHPVTGQFLGHRISYLGNTEITAVKPPVATAVIREANMEIRRGARLIPLPPGPQTITLKKPQQALAGVIVDGEREKIALSQFDVVYVDLGQREGLEPGNMLYLYRPRKGTHQSLPGHRLALPDELLGAGVVLSTHDSTSAVLVLKSIGPIYVGDHVTTVMD